MNPHTLESSAERKRQFLELVRNGETVKGAARALETPSAIFYQWKKKDEDFRKAWYEALGTNIEKRSALAKTRNFANVSPSTLGPCPQPGVVFKKDDPSYKHHFLMALAKGYSTTRAAEEADVAYVTVCRWRRDDPGFAEDWEAAVQQGIDRLEDEAFRRGCEGYDDVVSDGEGNVISSTRKYSDQLLALMLRAKHAQYRREKEESTPSGNVNTTINIMSVPKGHYVDSGDKGLIEGQPLSLTTVPGDR